MGDTELKPCPFCGGEAELLYRGNYAAHRFCREKCEEYDCWMASYKDELQTAEDWNTRKPMGRIVEPLNEIY